VPAIPRIAVLISGRGSNLGALLAAEDAGRLGGSITLVISNRADARGLELARTHGVATIVIDHRGTSRPEFDARLAAAIDAASCDLVVLAGFMRILGEAFVERYRGRLVNIHPSLLPSFGGLDTHRRALQEGVRIHGCTVHFVTPDLDHGPIIGQAAVPVLPGDDETTLAARVLAAEHELLPAAVRAFCAGRLVIAGHAVRVVDEGAVGGSLQVPVLS
jgi:phosphoribosylglycinamide formyltransferase-1